jgi:tripartite-type tricarboxylate transporter receptor subunit TctC
MKNRSRIRIMGAMALAGLGAPLVRAQGSAGAPSGAFPNRPVRIVVPYAAGGPSDTVTRVVGQRMATFLGQQVVVENRAGANALIGMEYVARQPGDGYTLVMFSQGGSVLNSAAKEKMPYDLVKDFRAVGNMATLPQVAVTNNDVPAKNLAEFVAWAKKAPKVSFGSSGPGGSPHLMGAWLNMLAGLQMTHVPYKGTGPATADLIAGHIQMLYTELPVLAEHIKAGKIRPIAIGTRNRSALLPDVPTVAESGFPELTGTNWFGLEVPSSTPDAVVKVLNDALVKSLEHPETKAALQAQGADPDPGPPEKFDKFVRDELARWSGVIKATKVQLN